MRVATTERRVSPTGELDPLALAEDLAGWAEQGRAAVLRVADGSAELDRIRGAISRLLGLDNQSFDLRVRRALAASPPAIELSLAIPGGRFRFELAEAHHVQRSCFRGSLLAASHAGTLPAHASAELHRMGNHLARVDRAGAPNADIVLTLEWLQGGGCAGPVSETVSPAVLHGPEAQPVLRMLREYRRWHGSASPTVRRWSDGETLSLQFPADGVASESGFVLPPRILADAPSARYLRLLGFDWTKHGRLNTVPLPASYRAALERHALDDSGVVPVVISRTTMGGFDRRRLLDRTAAVLPIALASRWYYLPRRVLGTSRRRQRWESHFSTFLRDLGTQVLPCQLVPRRLLHAIGRAVRVELATMSARTRLLPPEALLLFYERDFFLHCQAAWSSVSGIDELPGAFVAKDALSELVARLRERLREAGAARRGSR